ncbi:armadillo-type protein [Cyathus striatus]|nr:armadillo-type protein [Cyathus striatus]
MSASQDIFQRLKPVCVPLLASSRLTHQSIPQVSRRLTDLIAVLRSIDAVHLNASLISYTFIPLSTILQRNSSQDIPDQILEKLFTSLSILCESWWWTCDTKTWEQIFMICGAVLGGIDPKGKGKARDDETKEAAASCLLALVHDRTEEDATSRSLPAAECVQRLSLFKDYAQSDKFIPILGQTIDSALGTAQSQDLSLQKVSLALLDLFLRIYAPMNLIPTIFPGVVSSMTKIILGTSQTKGWVHGEIVSASLNVMQTSIVNAIGDQICIQEGALRPIQELEDLAELVSQEGPDSVPLMKDVPYLTRRTASWLRGTASQLHIALNSLTPLLAHPSPVALRALSKLSSSVLHDTWQSLPQTQPLLLSFLLSLSNAPFTSVSKEALQAMQQLMNAQSPVQPSLLNSLMRITSDNLSSLPRLLSIQADAKVSHVAGLIEAVCRLADAENSASNVVLRSVTQGIGQLLGPSGGIEKWGWSLLSVLEFSEPHVVVSQAPLAVLTLESDPSASLAVNFPELQLKNVSSRDTQEALVQMFRALGYVAGDHCLFSVEWFVNIGQESSKVASVSAFWCACRLLEGVSGVSSFAETDGNWRSGRSSKRVEKLTRVLTRTISEIWDKSSLQADQERHDENIDANEEPLRDVEHQKGLIKLHDTLRITHRQPLRSQMISHQPVLHRSLCLQVIAVGAGIMQGRFGSHLIYVIYPVLHSLVSSIAFLSSTALATLHAITIAMSYATPANLLLSNFDYALDGISRRLTRRWLDIDATKVLAVLVRLVGSDIIDKASDVVEECFDRLDEFHRYDAIVEGIIEVLGEVIKIIELDMAGLKVKAREKESSLNTEIYRDLTAFHQWFTTRHHQPPELDTTDYGPAPRESWGKAHSEEPKNEDTIPQAGSEPIDNSNPLQALTSQMVTRSMYFLTHQSPIIRARILSLLASAVSVLPESALLSSIHSAWPFILNRLGDKETFVVSAAARLIEALVDYVGGFMFRRIWDDVWPKFHAILVKLDKSDATSALAIRSHGTTGTESAYTHSHRLYKSIIRTMTSAIKGVRPRESSIWQIIVIFRRFLNCHVHTELQSSVTALYMAIGTTSPSAVWLGLSSTLEEMIAF